MSTRKLLACVLIGLLVMGTGSLSVSAAATYQVASEAEFKQAVTDAAPGDTIQLIGTITMTTSYYIIDKSITLDLNGQILTSTPGEGTEEANSPVLVLRAIGTPIDITITDTAQEKGKMVCGSNTNIKRSTSSPDTLEVRGPVNLTIDGAVIEGGEGINTRNGGLAVWARYQEGKLTITNGAVIRGGDTIRRNINADTVDDLVTTASSTAGDALQPGNSSVLIQDSTIEGGDGVVENCTQSTAAAGGNAITLWNALPDLQIENSTIKGGDSSMYNAGSAIAFTTSAGDITANITGSKIYGGNVIEESGGIGGTAMSISNGSPTKIATANVTITDTEIQGGNGGAKTWIGDGIDLGSSTTIYNINIEECSIAGGERGVGFGSPIRLSWNHLRDNPDTVDISLTDTTLKASENAYGGGSVIYTGQQAYPAPVNVEGNLKIEEGILDNVTVKSVQGNAVIDGAVDVGSVTLDPSSGITILIAKTAAVKFVQASADDQTLYNIVIAGEQLINRLSSAQLAFKLESDGAVSYEILPYGNVNAVPNTATADENDYLFYFDGAGNTADETATEIVIGQVKFNGFGSVRFTVDGTNTENAVHAATLADNIVTDFIVGGGSEETVGELIINDEGNGGVIDTILEVPTYDLTVNVTFPNAVTDNAAAYQDMTVTVSGGDLQQDLVYALGADETAMANGAYTVEIADTLTQNIAYTVTVAGAGYRTARYTVSMTEDKTLTFWNNVKDTAQAVETGKTTGAVTSNFLAGDIVEDNQINLYDLSAVVSYFGMVDLSAENNAAYAKYDLNRDGKIDSKDVAYVLVSWGN